MWFDAFKLAVPILLMLLLLWRKVHIAVAILVSGVGLALVFRMPWTEMVTVAARAVVAWDTCEFVLIVYGVLVLVEILKAKDSLGRLVSALRGMLRRKKLIITLPPALVGFLPMPAGALLPAPILNETLREDEVSPAVKTYINYWFRHIWEYSWPISPGVIVTAAIFKVDVMRVTWSTALFPPLAIAVGVGMMYLALPPLKRPPPAGGPLAGHLRDLTTGLWEIAAVVVPVIAFRRQLLALGIPTVAVLWGAVLLSWLTMGRPWRVRWRALGRALNPTLLSSSVAIMVFTAFIMRSPGVLDTTHRLIIGAGPFRVLVMFAVPFLMGFLTGTSNAFAGIAFPLFLSVLGSGRPDMLGVMYLYVAGFCGVLLSPVHFCLILSAEYYGARLKDVYRYLVPSVAVMAVAATLIYWLRGGR